MAQAQSRTQPVEGNERITVMGDDAEAPTVEVDETTVEAPDAVVEASPTIIVETPVEDSGSAEDVRDAVEDAVENERRFAALEQGQRDLWEAINRQAIETVETDAALAEAVVATAEVVEEQGDALAEEIEDSIPEEVGEDPKDEAPTSAREHWWFRSRGKK